MAVKIKSFLVLRHLLSYYKIIIECGKYTYELGIKV